MKIKEGGRMDIHKELLAYEQSLQDNGFFKVENIGMCTVFDPEQNKYHPSDLCDPKEYKFIDMLNVGWTAWQAAKSQAVPEVAQRQGGYYIRDLRSQPGNCMKFWYQAGYGTKHKNFFWCATLEEVKEYKGGCDWFEIWHAPYIDSLVEYTVDFQLADRGVGLVDLKAQEPAND